MVRKNGFVDESRTGCRMNLHQVRGDTTARIVSRATGLIETAAREDNLDELRGERSMARGDLDRNHSLSASLKRFIFVSPIPHCIVTELICAVRQPFSSRGSLVRMLHCTVDCE